MKTRYTPSTGRIVLCGLGLLLVPLLPGAAPEPPKPEDSITLPKFQVKGEPVCNFGIGVAGTREPETHRIKRLFIIDVTAGSEAERMGLQPGDEILGINGKKVAGMDGTKKAGAELFSLLVDQASGKTIQLEVVVHSVKSLTLTARTPIPVAL